MLRHPDACIHVEVVVASDLRIHREHIRRIRQILVAGEGGPAPEKFGLLPQPLFPQPRFESNLYGRHDPQRDIGAGLSDAELGLRLRHEIRHQFAPLAKLHSIRSRSPVYASGSDEGI
ncbi:MAG TPA: copper resistance protein B [Steroidobacteraceae bacterium]|nr:copper resistance protein B [Steroidobacteraceae bacterium]